MPLLSSQLAVGDLVAFQIGTHDGYSPLNQNRWGVFKVLHLHRLHSTHYLTVSVLDGLTDRAPTPVQVRFRHVLVEQRFTGRPGAFSMHRPLILSCQIDAGIPLPSATIIGREILLRPAERQALPRVQQTGHAATLAQLDHIALVLDHEDRARHDHANWSAEVDLANLRWQEKMQATTLRRNTRLRGLTLAILLTETPLADWDARPGSVSPDVTAQIRDQARTLMRTLADLGPKVPRAAARRLLSGFVTWLNQLDTTQGGLIETPEREDLMALLEEICWAIRQEPLLAELDTLRIW